VADSLVLLRNAIVGAAAAFLLVASVAAAAFFSLEQAIGLVLGGLLSIGAFLFGARGVRRALSGGGPTPLLTSYGLRLAAFAAGLFLAARSDRIGFAGFAVGLFSAQVGVYLVEFLGLGRPCAQEASGVGNE